tara:strand:- start:1068 stop:2378 length:1311 start_codon:yes stop_codon:yes gene_type:complete
MKPLCVVSCPIDTFSGYGARSRDFVKALIELKDKEWDIKILPQKWGETPWNFLSQNDPLKKRFIPALDKKPEIWIQITVPNEFQPVGNFNIGVSAGIETNIYPSDFIQGSNKMNLNLVSSEHSRQVALGTTFDKINEKTKQKEGELSITKPVEVLFEGLNIDVYNKKSKNSKLLNNIPEDFCFLFTGHWLPGKFGEDRKNVGLMIKTFLESFKGSSKNKPALILKTNEVNYSLLDRERILKKINSIKDMVSGNLPNIYLLHGEITNEEMNLINNDPKVKSFISFTKGEGFGRPLLEAAITGKPIITTAWSGHRDFLQPDTNILIGGELKNIDPSSANKFLIEGSSWFNINPDVASRAMKDVYKHYKKYLEKTRKQTQYIKDNFSYKKMVERLDQLLPKVEVPKIAKVELPKLKKITKQTPSPLPKVELPKLKKIKA